MSVREQYFTFLAEKEAIFLILTGIGDEIYSTVDACTTAKEMWTAIERLQQGESLNVQDVKTNLFWEFGKFTSRDGESWVQFQNEVNDIRSEKLARSANPLALLAAAQPNSDNYYEAPVPQRSNAPSYKQSSSTRPSASTRHKGKEIAKPVTPPIESVLRIEESVRQSWYAKEWVSSALNCKGFGHYERGMQEDSKRSEQDDWLRGTDEEIDEQDLVAHYSYMAKIRRMASNVVPDSSNYGTNDNQVDSNATDVLMSVIALAYLIAILTRA
ncbi:hypothetical protein Tco_1293886 [Tanacetum coccineum]